MKLHEYSTNKTAHFRVFRPFRLMRAIARARVKSHIQLKRSCSIGYSSFNPSFLFTSAIFE